MSLSGHGMHRILLTVAVQMARASVHFVEFNPDGALPPEGMHANRAPLNTIVQEETIFLAMYAGNHWISRGVDASDPTNVQLLRGVPSWPVIARFAMHAFDSGAVLEPPERRAPYNYFCWVVDSCFNDVYCEDVHLLKMMTPLLVGDGVSYLPATSILGGTWWMEPVAQLASVWAVPDMGFWTTAPGVANQKEFPFYLRVNSNGRIQWEGIAALLQYLNYTKVMVWHTSDAESLGAKEIFMDNQGGWNMQVQTALCPEGVHTGLPPDAEITREADPERITTHAVLLRQARTYNAHANVNALSSICPVYDLFHYLSINGLFGKGQLWVGQPITIAIYHQDYLYAIQFGRVMQGLYPDCPPDGSVNCFLVQTPLEGYVSLSEQMQGDKFPEFWTWWQSFRHTYHEVAEPFIADQVEDAGFDDPVYGLYSSWWRLPTAFFIFDSVWATLLSINALLLRKGRNFTGHELLEEMKNTSFEGITGHVSFDENGDRRTLYNVDQYQRECPQDRRLTPEASVRPPRKLASPRRISSHTSGVGNSSGNGSNSSNSSNATNNFGYPSNCNAQLGAFLANTSDLQLFVSYGECLVMRCEDMNPFVVGALSQGRFATCEQLYYGVCQKCDFDLGSMSDTDSLPLGYIFLRNICGAQCPRGPVKAGDPPFSLPVDYPECPGYPLPPQPLSCFGYPAPGQDVTVGTYIDGILTMTGTPFQFHSCAPKPPDRDLACGTGQFYNRVEAICEKCTPGRFSASLAQSACQSCQAGSYSALIQASSCEACGMGTFANVTEATMCLVCSVGRFQNDIQQSTCRDCTPGKYSIAEASFECFHCELGRFATARSATECEACGFQRTTIDIGSESEAECRCQAGAYSQNANGTCMDCPPGMVCEFGAELTDWWRSQEGDDSGSLVYPKVQAMMWSDPQDPLSVFKCKTENHCPGIGDPGRCGSDLIERSCAHCAENYYWSGSKCKRCSSFEGSRWSFPVIPILVMPLAILYMYVFFKDPPSRWGSWQNNCTTITFVLLNHYQVLALLSAASLQMPKILHQSQSSWSFTTDLWSIINPACAGVSDFSRKLIAQCLIPLVLLASTLLLYLSSMSLHWVTRRPLELDRDRLINVYMSIIYTFFNSISGISLTLFKCQENPNGKETLLADLSIICYGDRWTDLLGVGLAAITVYCFGCLVLLSGVIVVAPRHFQNMRFQMRWKFLFIKYRADVWWWAVPFLLKNFLYQLCFVVTPDPTWQSLWMLTITVLYAGGVCGYLPYRMRYANTLEIIVCISISYACTMMLSLEDNSKYSTPLSRVGVASILLPAFVGAYIIARTLYRRFCTGYYTVRGGKDVTEFLGCIPVLTSMADQSLAAFFMSLGEWDMHFMNHVSTMIRCDVLGLESASRCHVFHTTRDTTHFRKLKRVDSEIVTGISEVIEKHAITHGLTGELPDAAKQESTALLAKADQNPARFVSNFHGNDSSHPSNPAEEREFDVNGSVIAEASRPHAMPEDSIGRRHLIKMITPRIGGVNEVVVPPIKNFRSS